MKLNGLVVGEHERSGCFASFFENKVKTITDNTVVDETVYNGVKKVEAGDLMFMSINEVAKCLKSIKMKNSEGYDRIPQRVLLDGNEHLLLPMAKLFELIYKEKKSQSNGVYLKLFLCIKKAISMILKIIGQWLIFAVPPKSLNV